MDDFIAEHSRQRAGKTIGQNRAYLNILVEYFGPDRLLATITKQDASEVKKVLQALPANRNTKPKLKSMPLMRVINEPGHKKIAAKTINSHIQMFRMFLDWAERHGHPRRKASFRWTRDPQCTNNQTGPPDGGTPPNQASTPPFLTPMLVAVRCAFR